jgi:twitching motility protein PilT
MALPAPVEDLGTAAPVAEPPGVRGGFVDLSAILHTAVAHDASDVHIRADSPPLIRVAGELFPLDMPPLTPEQSEALVFETMPSPDDVEGFRRDRECDFAIDAPGIGRFRVNAYRARGTTAMVLRHVKEIIPSLDELGLPRVAHELAMLPSGLVLVCGPTGSGKTTTLAAMIDLINTQRRCHILTIEDPIEYLHRDRQSTISQRELHTDTAEFGRALRSGMRQDPDVILVGEIRDVITLRTALQAAETGHLVLASLHARTVVDAVNRIIDIFPVDEQRQARASIAESIQGILCQHLVQSSTPGERTVIVESAVATPRIREAILDPAKTGELEDIVADGQFYGMRTFQQDAVRLVLSGAISIEEAEKVVNRPADLHVALRRAGYRE